MTSYGYPLTELLYVHCLSIYCTNTACIAIVSSMRGKDLSGAKAVRVLIIVLILLSCIAFFSVLFCLLSHSAHMHVYIRTSHLQLHNILEITMKVSV